MASFAKLLGLAGNPSGWEDRVQDGAYTSPSGTRIKFVFQEVARDTEKRTTTFQFANLPDGLVQTSGYGPRTYPLRCIFWGANHDREATAFELAVLEDGVGKLEHPLYGTFQAVPTGTVGRRNDLVQAANQSIVEVTFSTTLAKIYPSASGFPQNELLASISGFDVQAAQQFSDSANFLDSVSKATGKAKIRAALDTVRGTLQAVSDQTAASRRAFDSQFRLINEGLDVLIGAPLDLAQQVQGLMRAPASALIGLRSRLDGYAAFFERLFLQNNGGSDGTQISDSQVQRAKNDFHIADLFAMSAASAVLRSAATNTYASRPEALDAAIEVQSRTDALVDWREGRVDGLSEVDLGGSHQGLIDATANGAGYLVDLSFSLLPERFLVTERARTPIDLCAQLYGSLDDATLQLFLDTNKFTGSEILEIPKGRRVVWYSAA